MRSQDNFPAVAWWGVTLAAWMAVIALRTIPVGGVWAPVSLATWLIFGAWFACYSLGFLAASAVQKPAGLIAAYPDRDWFATWTRRLSLLAALGAAMIVYEFAVLRGYGFTTDIALIRISEVNNSKEGFSGSGISGIGRLLTPALIPAWLLALMSPFGLRKSAWAALGVATLVVFYQQLAFEGGRFFMAALVLCALAAFAIGRKIRRGITGRRTSLKKAAVQALVIGVLLIAVVYFFGSVFVDRVVVSYPSLSAAYQTFAGRMPLLVRDVDYARLEEGGASRFALNMFWVYSTHAISQFERVFQLPDLAHAYGSIEFTHISKIISVLTGLNTSYDMFENLPQPGLYTTFLGVSYIDFGTTAIFASAALLGFMQSLSLNRLFRGRLSGFGLAAPLFVALAIFSPIHALVANLWPAIAWAFFAAWFSPQTDLPVRRTAVTQVQRGGSAA